MMFLRRLSFEVTRFEIKNQVTDFMHIYRLSMTLHGRPFRPFRPGSFYLHPRPFSRDLQLPFV